MVKATLLGGAPTLLAEPPVPKGEAVAAGPKPGNMKTIATMAMGIGNRNLVGIEAENFGDTR